MNTFKKKWNGVAVEDCGSYMSKEAKSFVTAFKRMLNREVPTIEENTITPNHYDLSGMIKIDGKYIYVSYNIPRWGSRISFNTSGTNGVLYRAARHSKDWTGGFNNFCSIEELPEKLKRFAIREQNWQF